MKKHSKYEKGQALILIAVGIIGLIGLTALAIDGGNAFSDRRHAQNAADTAALAGALTKVRAGDWNSAALGRASDNGYTNSDPNVTVTAHNPPVDGPYTGNAEYIQVKITSIVDTFFAKVVGVDQVTNSIYAVAKASTPYFTQIAYGNAVVGLSPTDCRAVKYQGNANTTLIGGGIFVNSNCPDSAYFNNSSAASLNTPCLTSVGGVTYKPGSLNLTQCSTPTTGAQPLPYPPEWQVPYPTCSGTATKTGYQLSPGNYSGVKFPPAGVEVLQPGVYCVSADFSMNASDVLSGNGVTIYMVSGKITWNGGATLNLKAPTTGSTAGWLIMLPLSNTSAVTINGNSTSSFEGTIYAPASDVSILGTGSPTGFNSQVIGYTVDLSGTSTTLIQYDDLKNADVYIPPKIELSE